MTDTTSGPARPPKHGVYWTDSNDIVCINGNQLPGFACVPARHGKLHSMMIVLAILQHPSDVVRRRRVSLPDFQAKISKVEFVLDGRPGLTF